MGLRNLLWLFKGGQRPLFLVVLPIKPSFLLIPLVLRVQVFAEVHLVIVKVLKFCQYSHVMGLEFLDSPPKSHK